MSENNFEYGDVDHSFYKFIKDLFNSWLVRGLLIFILGLYLIIKFELYNLFASKPKRSYRFANSETKTNTNSQIGTNNGFPQLNTNSHIDTSINIPQTGFLQDLISGKNLTNTRSFLLFSLGGILIFFFGKLIFENIDFKGNGIISAIWDLILVIISPIMMITGPLLLIGSLVNLSSASAEVFYYNRNKRIAREEVVMNEKKDMEYAIQRKTSTENFKLKIAKIEQLRKVNWDNLTTTEKEQALIIKNPITGDKLRVASKNLSKMMDYQQAMIECRALGSGWRLPTIEELKEMDLHLYQKGLGDFITYDPIQKADKYYSVDGILFPSIEHYHSANSDYNSTNNTNIQYSFILGKTLSSGKQYPNAWVRVVKSI